MPLFDITNGKLTEIKASTFITEGLKERDNLQSLLKEDIGVVAPDCLLISEEFGDFDGSKRRIDLLAINKDAELVVIELKRTEDGGFMDLQAIRYASMLSNMTWDQAVEAYSKYIKRNELEVDARTDLLDFLGWNSPVEENFAQDVKIVLVSGNFSKELTTSVLWLNDKDLDITCVRLIPHRVSDKLLLDVEQIIPVIETLDYQIGVKNKKREERISKESTKDRSLIQIYFDGNKYSEPFKKADIGLVTIQLLQENGLLTATNFEEIKTNRISSFNLMKEADEVSETEKKYSKYRVKLEPEVFFGEKGYYVVRNWGVGNFEKFIEYIEQKFPQITYEILY